MEHTIEERHERGVGLGEGPDLLRSVGIAHDEAVSARNAEACTESDRKLPDVAIVARSNRAVLVDDRVALMACDDRSATKPKRAVQRVLLELVVKRDRRAPRDEHAIRACCNEPERGRHDGAEVTPLPEWKALRLVRDLDLREGSAA